MIAKLRLVISSSLVKNTLKLSSSNVILILIPLFFTPILSRIYSPVDYGIWGIFSSVLSIVNSFIFLSYENTLVKTSTEKEIPNLIVLCFIISFSIIMLVNFIFITGKFIGIPFFVNFQSVPMLTIMLVITAIYNIVYISANRSKKYGIMAKSNIINGSSQAAIRVFLGKFPIITYGLIVGNIFSQLIATVYIIIPLFEYFKRNFSERITRSNLKSLFIKYKKFPIYDAPAKLIEFSTINLVIIILSNYYGRDDIGYFSMVIQFILLPVSLIGSAMGSVYYKELSENSNDPIAISTITQKVAKITFILSLFPLIFLTFGGDKLLVFLLGNKWGPAGSMALCMAIYSVPVILVQPLLPALKTLDKQEIRFRLNLLNFILSIGALFVSVHYFSNINIVLTIYSICFAFTQFWAYYKILKITNLNIDSVTKYFVLIIGISYFLLMLRLYFSNILGN